MWAGTEDEGKEGVDAGRRAVNVMDWPDCLEDVFALISCVFAVCVSGGCWGFLDVEVGRGRGRSWCVHHVRRIVSDLAPSYTTMVLAPSRALQPLESENGE